MSLMRPRSPPARSPAPTPVRFGDMRSRLAWMQAEIPERVGPHGDAHITSNRAIRTPDPAQVNPDAVPGKAGRVVDAPVTQSSSEGSSRTRTSRLIGVGDDEHPFHAGPIHDHSSATEH